MRVSERKKGDSLKKLVYVVWWRSRTVNWPALLNVKLPTKFYSTKTSKVKKNRKIFLYQLMFAGRTPVNEDDIQLKDYVLRTESVEEVLDYICANEFPQEIVDFFLAKV